MSQDVPIRPAATILLLRDDPTFEVLMVKRHHQIDFASGALVFPGGKTAPGDHDEAWAGHCLAWETTDPDQRPLRIAAIREAYEETGIILGARADGSAFDGDEWAHSQRQAVDRGELPFLDVVTRLDLRLDLSSLTEFARWITPPIMPKRFDTWFYLARATDKQLAASDGREIVDAEWIEPAEALRLAAAGERTVIFPTRMNIQLLAEASSADDAVARAEARELVPVLPKIEQREGGGVLVIPPNAGYGVVEEPLSAVR